MSGGTRVVSVSAPVLWTAASGADVSADGSTLTKTAIVGWSNAGARSRQVLSAGDGFVEWTIPDMAVMLGFGFSPTDPDVTLNSIGFGLYTSSPSLVVVESGAQPTAVVYQAGDVVRVAIVGSSVKYSKNGAVFYTSLLAPSLPLVVDCSLYSVGAVLAAKLTQAGTEADGVGGSVVRI